MGANTGRLARRAAALVVDALLVGLLFGLAAAAAALFPGASPLANRWSLPVAYLLYHVGFEGTYGYTPGKRLVGLVVVRDDGAPCDLQAAAIRNVLRVVDGALFYLVGLAVVLVTDRDRRIGDLVAGTTVRRASEASTDE